MVEISSVATQLSSNVTKIYSTADSFAALKDDGSVVSWETESILKYFKWREECFCSTQR